MAKNVGDRKCDKLLLSSSFLLLLLFCWHDGFLNILVFIFEHPKHHIPVHHGLEGPLQLLNGLYALVDSISLTQKVYTDFSGKSGWKRGGKGKEEKIDSERHLYFQLAKLLWYGSPPSTFGAYFQMSFDILVGRWNFATFMESLNIKFSHPE